MKILLTVGNGIILIFIKIKKESYLYLLFSKFSFFKNIISTVLFDGFNIAFLIFFQGV
jgi:hypothetical protein